MPKGYAVEVISSLPFGHLIGGPLNAAVEAQANAAKATIDFIQDVGFIPPAANDDMLFLSNPVPADGNGNPQYAEGDLGQTRMVTFTYSTLTVDGNGNPVPGNATLTVPLLTVVPIPYLEIAEMTIDFMAKISEVITSTRASNDQRRRAGSATASGGWGPIGGSLKGSYSSTHSSTRERTSKYQTELTMSIHVRAVSESLPKGMARVLDILANSIQQG